MDADGSTAFYKEFEMNAANKVPNSATWLLCLDAPHDDNSCENSGRVLGAKGFDAACSRRQQPAARMQI